MRIALTTILIASCILYTPTSHTAMADLDGPTLGFPKEVDQESIKKVMNHLHEEGQFISGHYINFITYVSYGASTQALSELIQMLEKDCTMQLVISFKKLGDDQISFTTTQMHDTLNITINLEFNDLDFDRLYIKTTSTHKHDPIQPALTYYTGPMQE